MADDHNHRQPEQPANGWDARRPRNLTVQAFDIASEAAVIRKEQEWQRRFPTPEARAEAENHERMADEARRQNDEDRDKRLKHIEQGWDRSRPQPQEFAIHINAMREGARKTWQAEKETIDRLLASALTHTENRYKTLAHNIGAPPPPKIPDPLIADHRSNLKRSWDDAGQQPQRQPQRSIVRNFNDESRGHQL